jgi:hypothetical protein
MDDIRRQDTRLFLKELRTPGRIVAYLLGLGFLFAASQGGMPPTYYLVLIFALLLVVSTAWSSSVKKRFHNKRMESLWHGCEDRLARFEEVLRRMRREQLAELREMPKTIRNVAKTLYAALRRADIIAEEVAATESGMLAQPPVWQASARDPQSKELYRLADKNIAEYRNQFAGVMAGVQRTEAQSAVFMTTLDSLRMKMIGYRLVGRSPELTSGEFLDALAEARAQLEAIDTALEELDLGHYPKTISVVPPPPPEEHLRINH